MRDKGHDDDMTLNMTSCGIIKGRFEEQSSYLVKGLFCFGVYVLAHIKMVSELRISKMDRDELTSLKSAALVEDDYRPNVKYMV